LASIDAIRCGKTPARLQGMNMTEYDNLKRQECIEFGKEVLKETV
jgi:hypothetical protein